ncbi:TetR/AcrR family transcriptional regulator [Amycolatopsis sp.]|uniref:TetR/AcrR family transcriptional regulator n=1 Tax=Amycolatopsis sp. TaxID=37632 RepID=UPI002CE4FF6C|nr:TetR/AcrR family transcriptional regulator [Amycolatopsis sp.]HVV11677.1 TetR/AcrR family transcriptional regulator [Amycolatopsis sp.]
MVSGEPEISDRRRLRGARSRQAITRRAVDIASVDGLDGLSFGRLADDLSISKAGIQTLFRTKKELQIATVETARAAFIDAVARPAQQAQAGLARVRALLGNWFAYAEQPLFPGGCFWSATLPEFDSHPGEVRDALTQQRREWLAVIAAELDQAVDNGEIAPLDTELAAFEIQAVLDSTNLALRLGDTGGVKRAWRIIDKLLTSPEA